MKSLSKELIKSKSKASLIHFLVSLSIFLLVLAWAWFIAYPSAYFTMSGALQGLALLFAVDVVLGPLLSFFVYNPAKSKKEIITDFTIIGIVQLAALCYGLYTLYQEHPKALVIYPKSTSVVLNHREVKELGGIDNLSSHQKIAGIPAVVNVGQGYQSLEESRAILDNNKAFTIGYLDDGDRAYYDTLGNQPYLLAVMAKYNGAYFVLDQDFNLVQKFGEKPVS